MSVTHYFERVTVHRRKSGKCPRCGKRVTRSNTFEQTVNPFNRNGDGSARTFVEVRAHVEAIADAWVPDFTHTACAGGAA